jgi:hypothetical protein
MRKYKSKSGFNYCSKQEIAIEKVESKGKRLIKIEETLPISSGISLKADTRNEYLTYKVNEEGKLIIPERKRKEVYKNTMQEIQSFLERYKGNIEWNQEEGEAFIKSISSLLRLSGFNANIIGSVAYKGTSKHDLDLNLVSLSEREKEDNFDYNVIIDFFNYLSNEVQGLKVLSSEGFSQIAIKLPNKQVVDINPLVESEIE